MPTFRVRLVRSVLQEGTIAVTCNNCGQARREARRVARLGFVQWQDTVQVQTAGGPLVVCTEKLPKRRKYPTNIG